MRVNKTLPLTSRATDITYYFHKRLKENDVFCFVFPVLAIRYTVGALIHSWFGLTVKISRIGEAEIKKLQINSQCWLISVSCFHKDLQAGC